MTWPAIDTYEITDEQKLIDYLKDSTSHDLAANEFWPGDYDDLSCALLDAGWRVTWYAPYWFAAQRATGGTWAEYIEGDLYARDTLWECDLYKETIQSPAHIITIYENGHPPQVIADF